MSGVLFVNHPYAGILFHTGATHSFVNFEFTKKLANKPEQIDIQLHVATTLGTIYHTGLIFKDCAINVEGRTLPTDLAQLEMQGLVVILGKDW